MTHWHPRPTSFYTMHLPYPLNTAHQPNAVCYNNVLGALEASESDFTTAEQIYQQACDEGVYDLRNGHELDLHYCSAATARVATRHACKAVVAELDGGDGGGGGGDDRDSGLTIITGVGHHTPGGTEQAVLAGTVRAFLSTGLAHPKAHTAAADGGQAGGTGSVRDGASSLPVPEQGLSLEYSEVEGNAGRLRIASGAIRTWAVRAGIR
jgi:hypothetical protein